MSISNEEKLTLINKRNALKDRLEAINDDFRHGMDKDAEERAIQLENVEVLDGIARATEAELIRIEQRLAEL
jgi:hypothetical protein